MVVVGCVEVACGTGKHLMSAPMPDGGTVHTKPVTLDTDLPAAPPAVRAAMRIALRNGCALSRDAAEQIVAAVLALNHGPLNHGPAGGQITTDPATR